MNTPLSEHCRKSPEEIETLPAMQGRRWDTIFQSPRQGRTEINRASALQGFQPNREVLEIGGMRPEPDCQEWKKLAI